MKPAKGPLRVSIYLASPGTYSAERTSRRSTSSGPSLVSLSGSPASDPRRRKQSDENSTVSRHPESKHPVRGSFPRGPRSSEKLVELIGIARNSHRLSLTY